MYKNDLLKNMIDEIFQDIVGIRRHIHSHPELGFNEFQTANLISKSLKELDYEVYEGIGTTGVVACFKNREGAPAIAYRADMDALPIQEKNDVDYASVFPGIMHACGHDGHVAVLLGAAKIFAQIKDQLNYQIVLIFQPAEEGPGGAKPIIKSGILKQFNIKGMFGLHVLSTLERGKIGIKRGAITASIDNFLLTIKGKSSHAARPEQGIDAIFVACQVVNNLQGIISRRLSASEDAVLTIGKIQGGYRRNVIADSVCLEGTVRCTSPKTRDNIESYFLKMVDGVTKAHDASYELNYDHGYPAVVNDRVITDFIVDISQRFMSPDDILILEGPELWGEDFAYFLQEYPGAFFYLGGAVEGKEMVHHHSPNFNFDEECMKLGIEIFVNIAMNF